MMDKFVINGGKRLEGKLSVSGSKNAALAVIAASILSDDVSTIYNVPNIADVRSMIQIVEVLGAKSDQRGTVLRIDPSKCDKFEAPYDLVRKMRASVYALGALLGRSGRARVSFPGGCVIGQRPVDLHLTGLEKLGAHIEIEHGYIVAHADKLMGADINLRGPHGSSVGATANVMMAAVKAEGTTIIRYASCELQIVELAKFLSAMGAKIDGVGTPLITIHGVKELQGTEHNIMPDQIEAATYMLAGAITRGSLLIENGVAHHMEAMISKLREAGVAVQAFGQKLEASAPSVDENSGVRVTATDPLKPVDIRTEPYPGFPTDVQSQMMSLLATIEGISVITETVHPERFMHVSELNRMGANIKVEGNNAIVKGVPQLSGAPVMASELRGGAGLVLAGLAARNQTIVSRVYHIDRGFERMEEKLTSVGADIERVSE